MKLSNILIAFIASLVLFTSCEEDEFLGPEIEGIGGDPIPVSELSFSKESIDFTTSDKVYFELNFQQATSWKLLLKGVNSGATKTFENVSKSIDESNSLWEGLSDATPYFQSEKVIATVSFPNFPDIASLVDTFTITNITTQAVLGVLISDFTSVPIYNFGNPEPASGGWGSDFPLTVNTNTAYPSPDASAYLYFEGAPWQANSPYIDILQIPTELSDTITSKYYPLYSDPSRVYINLSVYNTGLENTWFRVAFLEESTGETRFWEIRPTWDGWKSIAIKYSDLETEGSKSFDPTTITLTNLILFSDEDNTLPNRSNVSIAIDQLEFSFDSPLGSITY